MPTQIWVMVVTALAVGCRRQGGELQQPWWETDPATYYSGDLYGMNLYLSLRPEGSYNLVWSGCCGVYGRAQGKWAEANEKITLQPTVELGEFTNSPLRFLVVTTNSRGHRGLQFPTNSVYVVLDPMFTQERLKQSRLEYKTRKSGELEPTVRGDGKPALHP